MRKSGRKRPSLSTGLGVDATGSPVIDPTENVIALTEAANRRQDDLREASQRYLDIRLMHLKEMAELRASHTREMRESEARRLDAIREIDVAARTSEADRAIRAIDNLAVTTKNDADKIRSLVDSTAQTLARQTSELFDGVGRRIAELERTSYKGEGKDTGAKDTYAAIRNALMLALALGAFAIGHFVFK